MPTFLLTQHAPKNFKGSPDPVATAAAVTAWFDLMGERLVARSNPAFVMNILGNCGADTEPFGYTLVTADDPYAALALAGGCPILAYGGGVEVRELMDSPLNFCIRGCPDSRLL
jgi:hypothetical protein